MTEQAAIKATYADYRRVKGRKVLQLIFEVPLEKAPDVHDTFGEPSAEGSTWVGIALLDLKQQLQQSVEIERKKEPREWSTLKRSQQAGIACSDPEFWAFLNEHCNYSVCNQEDAATAVRDWCNVNTRADFDAYDDKAKKWDRLYGSFQFERRGAIA